MIATYQTQHVQGEIVIVMGIKGGHVLRKKITMQIPENSCYLNNAPRVIHVDGVLLHGVL